MAEQPANMENGNAEGVPLSPEELQQSYYECLGDRDWDCYNFNDHVFLKRNIGFAIFGNPNDENCIKNNDVQDTATGYNKKQNCQINEVYEAILNNHYLENASQILMRIIFICAELKNKKKTLIVEPVFVVKKCHGTSESASEKNCKIFIDSSARVYQTWQLYLENNKLPKCIMHYPKDGHYRGQIRDNEVVAVIIETSESPACSIGNAILNGTDTAGTVVSVGSTLTFAAAIIPGIAVAPALLAASAVGGVGVGLYSVGRSISTLVDRKKHEQSIGLGNSESRWCWLNTTVGILGASASAATGLLTRAASKGVEISQAARIAFNTLNAANMIGSATNLGLMSYHVVEKLINNERPSAMEIFQLGSSVLFFQLSVVNFRTASTIISETQSATLINYEQGLRSNRHRKLFRKAQLEARRLNGEAAGNAEVIRGIRNINDPDNFFAGLARVNKDLNKNGGRYTITQDGKVTINSNYIVDPMEFAQMGKKSRVEVLQSLPPYLETPTLSMPETTFNVKMSLITKCCNDLVTLHPSLIARILQDLLNNKFDLSTMTALFKNYSEGIIKSLLEILAQFMTEIKGSLEDFKKIHPLVSGTVGALQFLIYHVEELASAANVDLSVILMSCFNIDNTVNEMFLFNLIIKFSEWVRNKMDKLRCSLSNNFNPEIVIKQRMGCKICSGHYYETK